MFFIVFRIFGLNLKSSERILDENFETPLLKELSPSSQGFFEWESNLRGSQDVWRPKMAFFIFAAFGRMKLNVTGFFRIGFRFNMFRKQYANPLDLGCLAASKIFVWVFFQQGTVDRILCKRYHDFATIVEGT